MKQSVRFCCLLLTGILSLAACNPAPTKAPSVVDDTMAFDSAALRIGYLPTLDALPLLVAEEEGLFDSLHADIQLIRYTSNMDIDTAFTNRRIHGALTDICRAILHNAKQPDVKVAGKTQGASALITQHKLRLRKIGDLPERMVAIARNEASDWMLDQLLDEAQMDKSIVNRPQINNVQLRQEMVEKEMIDAAIVPEPYATQAVVMGDRQLWSTQEKGFQAGCIIFTQQVLNDREEELKLLATAYNIATNRLNNAPKGRYDALMQRSYGINSVATDTLQLPRYESWGNPDPKLADEAASWLKNRYEEADWLGFRVLKTDYKTNNLFDNRLTLE